MKPKKAANGWMLVIALLALVAFVGCDLAGYDITDIEAESRKAKVPSGGTVATMETGPTVQWGTDGELNIVEEYEYLDDHVYVRIAESDLGGLSETLTLDDKEYELVGTRFLGYTSSSLGFWAGQDLDAGRVAVSNDRDNFYVTIDTNELADIQEYHIYAYSSLSGLPVKRPAPGLAPFTLENVNGDTATAVIPLSFFGASAEMAGSYYFIVHAALIADATATGTSLSLGGETAYAGGNEKPTFDGKGAWYYVVGYTVKPVYEAIYKPKVVPPVDTGDYFPAWGQNISNIVLVFDTASGDTPINGRADGYYTVKIDGITGSAPRDLDTWIDAILAYLNDNDPILSASDPVFLGAVIKGGTQITKFFTYGSGDNGEDSLPEGIGFSLNGTSANVNPTNAIDVTYNYGDIL